MKIPANEFTTERMAGYFEYFMLFTKIDDLELYKFEFWENWRNFADFIWDATTVKRI